MVSVLCRDERILQRSGRDAIQYLTFQRYLLVYMVVVVVICIGIILPVNFMGEQGIWKEFLCCIIYLLMQSVYVL